MDFSNSRAVAADEAKNNFTHLLEWVAGGEEITITEEGVPVARLIPVPPVHSIERRRQAMLKMDEIASRCRLDGLRIKDLINEGRR